jgi:hypothetical protein
MSVHLRKPLVHIVILGTLIGAAVFLVRGPSAGDASKRVIVTGMDVLQLEAGFRRTWQRPPTASELRNEISQHIRQEVLYREALARGFDKDDLAVRRAMQQKMDFLALSQIGREPPTEKEIEAFFALRRERYRLPAVMTLAQVYVSPDREDAARIAAETLTRLRSEDPPDAELFDWGDRLMIDPVHVDVTEDELARTFGTEFPGAVVGLPVGEWSGPVASGFGLHLVKVIERQDGRIPEWTEVASRVIADMEYEASQAAKEQLYQEIVQNYQIVLDRQVREALESNGE